MSRSLPEPSSISECDRALVRELRRLLDAGGVSLIGLSGAKLEIPETLCAVLVSILALLGRGECFHMIPRKRAVTTERATWILGMSRRTLFFGNVQSRRMERWTGAIRFCLDWALHRDRRSFRACHSLIHPSVPA
jgi:hypothetical protein